MKKIYLFLYSFAISSSLLAQSYSTIPSINDQWSIRRADTSAVNPGPSGSGVVWDFTGNLNFTQADTILTYQASSGEVSGATMKVNDGLSTSFYSKTSATPNKLIKNGLFFNTTVGQVEIKYTNAQDLITYPFNFTAPSTSLVNNDPFSGTITVPGIPLPGTISGSSTSIVDGKGTLKLATGTYNNVIRVKIISSGTVALVGGELNQLTYQWFLADEPTDVKNPLLEINTLSASIPSTFSFTGKTVYVNKNINTGVKNNTNNTLALNVSPNPSNGNTKVRFNLNTYSDVSLQVFNTVGQLVFEDIQRGLSSGEHNKNIDFTGLSKGVYVLRLITNNTTTEQKIVVE